MPKYKKCVVCGENILPTDIAIPYKGRYAHQKCFDEAMKTLNKVKKETLKAKTGSQRKRKPQAVLKDGMSEEEYAKKKQYYDYLKSLINDDELSVKQFAVSEKYIEHYGFNFEGMYQTLVYCNEILHKELKGDIVGIIPYYYSDAQNFLKDVETIESKNKTVDWNKYYPLKIIKINSKKRKNKELDITSIGE